MYKVKHMKTIRYNSGSIASRHTAKRAGHIIPKLGRILSVEGVRFKSRNGTREAVKVTGENGTALIGGVCWSYRGEGPHALVEVLKLAGIYQNPAEYIAFETKRLDDVGTDWKYNFQTNEFSVRDVLFQQVWHKKLSSPPARCEVDFGYGT